MPAFKPLKEEEDPFQSVIKSNIFGVNPYSRKPNNNYAYKKGENPFVNLGISQQQAQNLAISSILRSKPPQ